ncbi:hypothetical protein QLQ12_00520 [Actinoplanes sp. NEAU-A12]|uniref:Uncharacterized protein n=1 Tax=Actinoplanes sandaracinus TaxID=3045177 RepID=A0ABT6WBI8_9ACTN|nr:hypothetical protein [Actinoplanes sandaracinus]MDI6097091.1 hypothetical protein [Actinoplanes sandaracinus]
MNPRLSAGQPEQHHRRWIDTCPRPTTIMNALIDAEIKNAPLWKKNGS